MATVTIDENWVENFLIWADAHGMKIPRNADAHGMKIPRNEVELLLLKEALLRDNKLTELPKEIEARATPTKNHLLKYIYIDVLEKKYKK